MSMTTKPDGGEQTAETITVGETNDEPYTLPIEELLTGRLFATGKSGAGKSNTGSVIAEDLLERGHPLLIVDVDGEYWGLKEEFEILYVGATEECDLQIGAEHAGKLAELALEQHVPIVLDVSGYIDDDEADAIVRETARELFAREQQAMQPFLMLVEEIHEYIPQQGGLGDVGEMLIRVAKRGRKRGLGIAGLSQRPADVKKDFITQADFLVWHRLTWDNDTDVVDRVVGSEYAEQVSDLDDGEAFVQADWTGVDVERVQFRRKRTFDAGATPGLDDVDRPELKSIDEDLVDELEEISDRADQRRDKIARLEQRLEDKDDRIEELETELENQQNIADAAQQMADALRQGGDSETVLEDFDTQIEAKNERIRELENNLESVTDERDQMRDRVDDLEREADRLQVAEERIEQAEQIETQLKKARKVLDVEVDSNVATVPSPKAESELRAQLQDAHERIDDLEAENERLREQDGAEISERIEAYEDFLSLEAVQEEIKAAKDECGASPRYVKGVLAGIISENGPVSYETIAERLGVSTTSDVSKAASELERRKIVTKDRGENGMLVDLNTDGIKEVRQAAAEREKTEQLMEEL